jgi:hypothetical protein
MNEKAASKEKLTSICRQFRIDGDILVYRWIPAGHINTAYYVAVYNGKEVTQLLVQKINTYVFKDPVRLMENVSAVTRFLHERVDDPRHALHMLPARDGKYYHVDATPHAITWIEHFKMTESTIVQYTQNPDVANHRPNYYVYDHTLPEYQNIEIAQ